MEKNPLNCEEYDLESVVRSIYPWSGPPDNLRIVYSVLVETGTFLVHSRRPKSRKQRGFVVSSDGWRALPVPNSYKENGLNHQTADRNLQS